MRSAIKNQASKFFDNIPEILNTALQILSIYDERAPWKRPRATLNLPENIEPGYFYQLFYALIGLLFLYV